MGIPKASGAPLVAHDGFRKVNELFVFGDWA
jgi:hypothetical protein